MKYRSCLLMFLVLASAFAAFSQNEWEKTPYQNWTKDVVRKILYDSPWIKTKEFQQRGVDTRQVGLIIPPAATARIVLRSALTVRQALLRERQLEAKYDKKSDADKKAFDEKNAALLNCPACKDYYVVSVAYGYLAMDNKNYVADRKKYVYLSNDAGDKRELAEFTVLSQQSPEVAFFFPRRNEKGEDLITSKSTKLIFNFELKGMDGKSTFPFEKIEFDVSKFIVDDKVIF